MQQEQQAGLVLVIGAQEDCSIEIQRHFRGWSQKTVTTDCSSLVVIWDTDSWHVTPTQKDITSYPVHRTALSMRLRRVTARRVAQEDKLFVLPKSRREPRVRGGRGGRRASLGAD